jgi:hypothetical protein
MGTISGCSYLKLNLKAKIYIYVNSTTQRCPNKIIKIFQFEDFSHLPPVSATPVVHLELRISPQIFEKIRNGSIGILGAWGKLIHEKKQKSKISWHCPFKLVTTYNRGKVGTKGCIKEAYKIGTNLSMKLHRT